MTNLAKEKEIKIIAIGDIHGYDTWKKIILENLDADKIIFLGDYFDNFGKISSKKQLKNYVEIKNLKRDFATSNQDTEIIILIGNHDLHYVNHYARCGGFNYDTFSKANFILVNDLAMNILLPAYQHENLLFSHAGFTKTWCSRYNIDPLKGDIMNGKLQKDIIRNPLNFAFCEEDRHTDDYGDDTFQSPVWVRPSSLIKDKLDNFTQIVGHTNLGGIVEKDDIYFCDALNVGQYLNISIKDKNIQFKIETI